MHKTTYVHLHLSITSDIKHAVNMLIVHYYTRLLKIEHKVVAVFCWDHAKCLKPKTSILRVPFKNT